MSITDKKGINVTSGFKLISPQPIDARMVVEDENELVSIVDSAAAYEGQLVYVKSLDKYVSFDGSQFNELETGGGGAYVEGETLYLNAAESGSSSGSTGGSGGGGSTTTSITLNFNPTDYPLPTTEGDYNIPIQNQDVITQLQSLFNDIADNKLIPQAYSVSFSANMGGTTVGLHTSGMTYTYIQKQGEGGMFAFKLVGNEGSVTSGSYQVPIYKEVVIGLEIADNISGVIDCTRNTSFIEQVTTAYTQGFDLKLNISFIQI